jgi:hypothetical protein
MGNPFIRSDAFQPAAQPAPSGNGILAKVSGALIAQGANQLPPAGADQPQQQEVVFQDVPYLGAVRITYELNSYSHGRSKHWHWRAVRADLA